MPLSLLFANVAQGVARTFEGSGHGAMVIVADQQELEERLAGGPSGGGGRVSSLKAEAETQTQLEMSNGRASVSSGSTVRGY